MNSKIKVGPKVLNCCRTETQLKLHNIQFSLRGHNLNPILKTTFSKHWENMIYIIKLLQAIRSLQYTSGHDNVINDAVRASNYLLVNLVYKSRVGLVG